MYHSPRLAPKSTSLSLFGNAVANHRFNLVRKPPRARATLLPLSPLDISVALDNAPNNRAGCRLGIWEINYGDTHFRELPLKALPLRSTLPVVAFEYGIETQFMPRLHLVVHPPRIYLVNEFHTRYDFCPFTVWNDGFPALQLDCKLVSRDTDNQSIALDSSIAQDVQVANVKQIEDAGGIPDYRSSTLIH
jgi:hypothetical protein